MKAIRVFLPMVALTGCMAGSGGQASQPVPGEQGASAPVRSAGKATAPVEMDYRFDGKVTVGEAVALRIDLETRDDARLFVAATADEALGLASRERRLSDGRGTITLPLAPLLEGRFYVDVVAVLEDAAGVPQQRIFTIPVQVGGGAPVRAGKRASVAANGERLVRMQSRSSRD